MGDFKKLFELSSKVSVYVIPHAVFVCISYLLGFWGVFGFNIIRFMTFQELISRSIYPYVLFLCMSLISIFISRMTMELTVGDDKRKYVDETPDHSKQSDIAARLSASIENVYLLCGPFLIFFAFIYSQTSRFHAVPYLVIAYILVILLRSGFLWRQGVTSKQAILIFTALVGAPVFGFTHGAAEAETIISGKWEYWYFSKPIDGLSINDVSDQRLLDVISDKVIIYNSSNGSISLIETSKLGVMTLQRSNGKPAFFIKEQQ